MAQFSTKPNATRDLRWAMSVMLRHCCGAEVLETDVSRAKGIMISAKNDESWVVYLP